MDREKSWRGTLGKSASQSNPSCSKVSLMKSCQQERKQTKRKKQRKKVDRVGEYNQHESQRKDSTARREVDSKQDKEASQRTGEKGVVEGDSRDWMPPRNSQKVKISAQQISFKEARASQSNKPHDTLHFRDTDFKLLFSMMRFYRYRDSPPHVPFLPPHSPPTTIFPHIITIAWSSSTIRPTP